MGANAGGANVGGVQQREQGSLLVKNDTLSSFTGSPQTVTYTVPAGKIWLVKAVQSFSNNGTVSACRVYFSPDGTTNNDVQIIAGTTSANGVLGINIFLPAGAIIQFQCTYSVAPDSYVTKMIYQEMNA